MMFNKTVRVMKLGIVYHVGRSMSMRMLTFVVVGVLGWKANEIFQAKIVPQVVSYIVSFLQ